MLIEFYVLMLYIGLRFDALNNKGIEKVVENFFIYFSYFLCLSYQRVNKIVVLDKLRIDVSNMSNLRWILTTLKAGLLAWLLAYK